MSLSGSIEDLPLLEILQVVAYCQKTGHLVVHAPQGDAGVVFREGRVVSGYIWDSEPTTAGSAQSDEGVRGRIAAILERLVRLREGEFAFNLTEQPPTRLGERDLTGEILADGINPEELMLDLARKLDEDRREGTATIEATFSAATGDGESELHLEELPLEDPGPPSTTPAVLIVDDEPEVCRVVGRHLAGVGYEVVPAGSVAHAQHEMSRLAARDRRFLLIVDLGLPSAGTNFRGGLDVVRFASGLTVPPPVLLMTETVDEKLRGRAKRMGISMIAFKPGLSKLDPLQYEADLRAFSDRLARDLLPRLGGRGRAGPRTAGPAAANVSGDAEAVRRALREIAAEQDPNAVALMLLRAARSFFARAVLFVVKDDCLRGVSGFGPSGTDGPLDLVSRGLSVPLDTPSPLADGVATGRAWAGPIADGGPLRDLVDSIGALEARFSAVLPIRASRQTIALLYADAPDGSAMPPIEPFARVVEEAGRAFDSALLARRAVPEATAC